MLNVVSSSCGQIIDRRREMNFEEWALERSIPEPNSGCWLWLGYVNSDGYGRATINNRVMSAHRHAYRLANCCDLPPGNVVMHKCDTPACINPDHLVLGTQIENIEDRIRKGRSGNTGGIFTPQHARAVSRAKKGKAHSAEHREGMSSLGRELVRSVISDPRSNPALAKALGVHRSTVRRIRNGEILGFMTADLREEKIV